MVENVLYRPENLPKTSDIVICGSGPGGMYTAEVLRNILRDPTMVVLDKRSHLGGTGSYASIQLLRTLQGERQLCELAARTKDWFQSLTEVEELETMLKQIPYLFVAQEDTDLEKLSRSLEQVIKWGFGAGAELMTQSELEQQYPFISGTKVKGALFYPEAAKLEFDSAVQYITKNSPQTTFALGTTMGDIFIDRGKVIGVKTDCGSIATEMVILAPGPFILQAQDQIIGGNLLDGRSITDIFTVTKRQRFVADLQSLPPNLHTFVIDQFTGAYVFINTNNNGNGEGMYGWADPDEKPIQNPILEPGTDRSSFPAQTFAHLAHIIPGYGTDEKPGPLVNRVRGGAAGYYVDTHDDLPVISSTVIKGLYVITGLSHSGVMMGYGAALEMGNLVSGKDQNPDFSLYRSFGNVGHGLKL